MTVRSMTVRSKAVRSKAVRSRGSTPVPVPLPETDHTGDIACFELAGLLVAVVTDQGKRTRIGCPRGELAGPQVRDDSPISDIAAVAVPDRAYVAVAGGETVRVRERTRVGMS
jgi:hypothetical protein